MTRRACVLVLFLIGCGDDSSPETDGGRDASADSAIDSTIDAPDPDSSVDAGPMPGDWQLPTGRFTPARMPMTLVHPRDADTPAWVYAKNAYPGIRWEIPIVVQGGAWPFQYAIVDDGGATGLSIGGELARREEGAFIVHEVTPEYGVLWWDDPQAGSYSIQLRVTDQEGSTVDVPVSLSVGTDGWVFVEEGADDSSADGTTDAPFGTLAAMHQRMDSTAFADQRIYFSGTVPLDGNRPNGNLRLDPSVLPSVWVGRPGTDAVLEAYEGKFVVATPDFYLANLEYRHAEDYTPGGEFLHMLTVWDAPRYTIHDVTFSRMQGDPVNEGLGNSGVMMFTRGADRPFVAVVNCTITGAAGVFTSAYSLRNSVFEKNRWEDATVSLADGSVHSVVYIKSDNEMITIRANEMINNTWSGLSGLGMNEARTIEFAHNVVDTPYDSGRSGSLRLFGNGASPGYSWTTDTPVWLDRNSARQRISWEGNALENMPDGVVRLQQNAVSPMAIPEAPRLVSTDDVAAADLFDVEMRLTGAARDEHLGLRGAEIAVPIE